MDTIPSCYFISFMFFFFFSSRRRHTRLQGDWSSDVCSSALYVCCRVSSGLLPVVRPAPEYLALDRFLSLYRFLGLDVRSEERRVGKECRRLWSWFSLLK